MLVHFRRDGKVHRTICGQRYRPGRRPPVWRREWTAVDPLPDTERQVREWVDSRIRFVCPECARGAAIESRSPRRQESPSCARDRVEGSDP